MKAMKARRFPAEGLWPHCVVFACMKPDDKICGVKKVLTKNRLHVDGQGAAARLVPSIQAMRLGSSDDFVNPCTDLTMRCTRVSAGVDRTQENQGLALLQAVADFNSKCQIAVGTPDLKGKCQIAVGTTGPQPQGPDRSRHFIPDIIRHATTQHNHKRATHNSQSTMHSPCANRQLQTQSQTQHHKHNHTPSTANTTTNNRKRTTTSATRPTNTIIRAPTTTKAQPHQLPVCVKK